MTPTVKQLLLDRLAAEKARDDAPDRTPRALAVTASASTTRVRPRLEARTTA